MPKEADKYFQVNPWQIIEGGFNQEYGCVAESIFSLGNEYMGVRGYFEEGYSGKKLVGSYFNGIYEREKLGIKSYKGLVDTTEFMVNAVNWLAVRIRVKGETLDLARCRVSDFKRVLDMQSGLLTRNFLWKLSDGKEINVLFERFLSMPEVHIGVQRITFQPVNFDGAIEVNMEADFGEPQQMYGKNYWKVVHKGAKAGFLEIAGETAGTGQYLYSASRFACDSLLEESDYQEEKKIGKKFILDGKEGQKVSVLRIVWNDRNKHMEQDTEKLLRFEFEGLLMENRKWWNRIWETSDIVIEGDEENQQGIRYCIFQMMQTYHGAQPGNNIGAKGLTGEAYNGNAFWDTETYCLPFYIFNYMDAAKNLLLFRYKTLEEAKNRAEELDCKGAFYPIATISGKECCNLWQHASLQLQASTAVAYGIWFYEKLSQDIEFLWRYGAEMLVEISRMLATRGDWSADGKSYGYYCVMGPDEFQMMVNHNCYTNYLGRFSLQYTIDVLNSLLAVDEKEYYNLLHRLGVSGEELSDWKEKAEHMLILKDEESGIYEQHDGFFGLPHVDVDRIPIEDFPLYHHWSYDRIYRNDMIKQPDVLMFMLLFNHNFTMQELKANYEYYEPKCIHESSLSPSVHSILASQLGKAEEAYSFFRFATRMDLDNYNRNTEEGLHTTSIAAAWMNIVYGFGGMRSDGDILELNPTIPEPWKSYTFHIAIGEAIIQVKVEKDKVLISLQEVGQVPIRIYGRQFMLTEDVIEVRAIRSGLEIR